jgi:hypothetical protein
MPFSPSGLPWWGWLLCAGVSTVVMIIAGAGSKTLFDETENVGTGCLVFLLAIASGLAAATSGLIGIVLFVKWVWNN